MNFSKEIKAVSAELAHDLAVLEGKVAEVEQLLNGYRVGIECRVPLSSEGDYLAYQKKDGKEWGLVVIHGESSVRVRDAKKALRVEAANALWNLVLVLLEKAREEVQAVRQSCINVDNVIVSLQRKTGEQ